MIPELFNQVRLITDRFADEGVIRNAAGYVIEIYDNENYEVEFSKQDGTTYAQIVAHLKELEVISL